MITNNIDPTTKLGKNVKIWHFTYVGANSEIGDNTKVGSLTHVDYKVKIGKNCRIEGMVYIPPFTEIGDDVFVGPGVVFTNDPYPPSKKWAGIQVCDNAAIGAGAVILAGKIIGKYSVVGMGSVVTKDVRPFSVVRGNPAKFCYWTDVYDEKRRTWEAQK